MKISSFALMITMSVYILKLKINNELYYYIHPRYILFVTIAACICVAVVSLSVLYHKKLGNFKKGFSLHEKIIFIVIVLAIIIPAQPLKSVTASQRFSLSSSYSPNSLRLLKNTIDSNSDNLTIREWIILLNQPGVDLNAYEGRTVDITGFLYPGPSYQDPNEFYLARFVVSCCTADAAPVGIRIRYSWKKEFVPDNWLHIKGKIDIEGYYGAQQAVIIPEVIEKINIPRVPYIY